MAGLTRHDACASTELATVVATIYKVSVRSGFTFYSGPVEHDPLFYGRHNSYALHGKQRTVSPPGERLGAHVVVLRAAYHMPSYIHDMSNKLVIFNLHTKWTWHTTWWVPYLINTVYELNSLINLQLYRVPAIRGPALCTVVSLVWNLQTKFRTSQGRYINLQVKLATSARLRFSVY